MNKKEKFDQLTKRQFSFWSKWYDSKIFRIFYFEKLYGKIIETIAKEKDYLKPGRAFLDAACGTGEIIFRISRDYPKVNFTGIDFTEAMVKIAGQKNKERQNVKILNLDVTKLPFEDQSFDFIVCSDALHHFSDPESSLKELSRVSRKGAVFLLADPASNNLKQNILLEIFARLLERANRYFSLEEAKNLLQQEGFEVKSSFYFLFNNFLLANKKAGKG